ncbi:SDR family NAD(P)-dependent oxidoreductase [Nocardia yamanashiensis]|uniref:SDR family oxidoreductase n=1 Tax=Nocardia yamanashiensis TaxID=209247 RepID=UPI001E396C8A|nr:SDR family oxidoreductase [Nocardia yamanashiensis]UGT38846.1 SDR family NAD(P)-dependent oxidoreductase [Nocardia yamanashiensis]
MGALDGRVAVITGAGNGIGREHALLFAREGASVVVNDLGDSGYGEGRDTGPAEQVAAEIRALGGKAIANTDSVADFNAMKNLVDQAVSEFGRLDVVVNNAGILRDGFLASMAEDQFDVVIAVHLKGHFNLMRHAAAYWKAEAKAGRGVAGAIVNTASASGTLVPNAGQFNYGAAKAGIAWMTRVAAEELGQFGVRANAIAPVARTRLTEATPGLGAMMIAARDAGGFDGFSPANIAPLVAYLSTEKCPHTGHVFTVSGGSIEQLQSWTAAKEHTSDGEWTIDNVAAELDGWA